MWSQLTRNAYRRFLAGRCLVRSCPAALSSSSFARIATAYHGPLSSLSLLPLSPSIIQHSRSSRRTFFGVFNKPPRELKEPNLPPGYDVMLQFRVQEVENARMIPRQTLVRGFRQFIAYKTRQKTPAFKAINATQAFLTHNMLRYLLETGEGEEAGEPISFSELFAALELTTVRPNGKTENHLMLARLIHTEFEKRVGQMREMGFDDEGIKYALGGVSERNVFGLFLTTLTQYGASLEAVERLGEYWRNLPEESKDDDKQRGPWTVILRGLAQEGLEEQMLVVFKKMTEELGIQFKHTIHEIMTTFYAERNRVAETKKWFEKPTATEITPSAYMAVIKFAVRNNEQEWLEPIMEQLIASSPTKTYWDVIFQWAVLVKNQGVEDIREMFAIMVQQNQNFRPDGPTINRLIAAAIEKRDPYLAERFAALGLELGIQPSSTTMILQMNYRLDAGDLSGAAAIYEKLQQVGGGENDIPVINKYLRVLCARPEPDLETILSVTADIEHRHVILEPETVIAICLTFLKFEQQYEVIDTLSLHTVGYSLEERALVRKAFVDYICDRKVSTARVWDAYSLLRQFFPDTEPDERARLMDAFFDRRRPDLACTVFGHMRAQGNMAQRPTADIYVRCLEGLGQYPDPPSLKMVHNMLKMDTTVQLDTRLYNGLMLAYASCDDAVTAQEFWRDIANSQEGPSYNSLGIVFWACELAPEGDEMARQIWEKISRMELEVPPLVFDSYCGAIAASGNLEEAKKVILEMEKGEMGYGPGVDTLGVTYNALPMPRLKDEFEEWGREEYPELWTELEAKGKTETIDGTKYKVERRFEA
ncbi:complex I intermediate-associated protein 84, mitochondrial [Podospora australis]|uniref:Complex I intermediate-associated protein 84, mitochondrial n=1 Tax=Podospora australis TaxID=1536484 RepID=A0AAN7AMG9_9PEZI|nr:complex I intermediate-associated protein 84, mitochondrial [Podospora australis]